MEEVERKKKPSSSRMVCPVVEGENKSSHWIRNTCFGGFVTVVSASDKGGGGEHSRPRAVARLEGISKYDREGKGVDSRECVWKDLGLRHIAFMWKDLGFILCRCHLMLADN